MNNKFLFFKTADGFNRALQDNKVQYDSIAFIKERQALWTHNTYFGTNEGAGKFKGYFDSAQDLVQRYPNPSVGDWALIPQAEQGTETSSLIIVACGTNGVWSTTNTTYGKTEYDASQFVTWSDYDPDVFATKSDLQNAGFLTQSNLNQYTTSDAVDTKLNALYTTIIQELAPRLFVDSELDEDSNNPVANSTITNALFEKASLAYVNTALDSKLDRSEIDSINNITVDEALSESSINPVQNAAIASEINKKANTVDVQASLNTKANSSDLVALQEELGTKANKSDLSQYAKVEDVGDVVNNYVTYITQEAEKAKGYFDNITELQTAVPSPIVGDWAVVNVDDVWYIYRCATDGEWSATTQEYKEDSINLTQYAKKTDLDDYATTSQVSAALDQKQNALVSGSNIKTINGESLLGSENIQITTDYEYVDNKFDAVRILATTNNQSFLNRLNELENVLLTIQKEYISWKDDEDTPAGARPERSSYGGKFITLTVAEYNALVQQGLVQEDTYYFTYEGSTEPTTWHFGDGFPIIFSSNDNLGVFPITLI